MESGSLPAWVRTRSRQMGPKPAVVVVGREGDVAWTWSDLWSRTRQVALGLLDSGLEENEPVVVWGDLSLDVLVAEMALQAVGCWAIRFPAEAPPERVAEVARRAGAFRLMASAVDPAALARVGPALPSLRLGQVPTGAVPSGPPAGEDPWSEEPRLDARMTRIGPDALAVTVLAGPDYEPARTRVLTHRNLMGVGRVVGARLGTGEEDTWWMPPPWDTPAAWSAGLAACWTTGGILLLAPVSADPLQDLWRCHPSVVVTSREAGARLAARAADEVAQTRGPGGALARYCLREAQRGAGTSRLGALLREAADGLGWSALREVLGGRLRRIVLRGGGDDRSASVLRALGAEAWGLSGPREAGGALVLDRLPAGSAGLHLLDGARVRVEDGGALAVGGVSASPIIHVSGLPGGPPPAITPETFYRSDWRGRADGDRLVLEVPADGGSIPESRAL